MPSDLRLTFDSVPDLYDRYRPRYCRAIFDDLISYAGITKDSRVLEIGPGTGQASEPIINTGCRYLGAELGESMADRMKEKYGSRSNFDIICGDFSGIDFGDRQFDLIYSATAIHWIPENTVFPKSAAMQPAGGALAMITKKSDIRSGNVELYDEMEKSYEKYYIPTVNEGSGSYGYERCSEFGYSPAMRREYSDTRVLTAEEYVGLCGTYSNHIALPDGNRKGLLSGIYDAIQHHGGSILIKDTYIMYLARRV